MNRAPEAGETKSDFVSMVSHELRTPLASIKAYVEMLIDGEAADPDTQRQFYEVIQNEANRLGQLIDDILTITRIELGIVPVNKQPHELSAILGQAVEASRHEARAKNVTIMQKSAGAYQTSCDRELLYLAILRLLSNVLRQTPEGGAVIAEIRAAPTPQKLLIRITDTRANNPPKDLAYAFDKFHRPHDGNPIGSGNGLGLSLVRNVVETVHHGRVLVENHLGRGICLGIELERCG